jgi:hypothetical protein
VGCRDGPCFEMRAAGFLEADCAVCDADLWLVGCEVLDGAGDDDEGTKMVCLEHAATRGTPLISLFYRYTLDDLIALCD